MKRSFLVAAAFCATAALVACDNTEDVAGNGGTEATTGSPSTTGGPTGTTGTTNGTTGTQ